MAFTTIRVSPVKLMRVVRQKKMSKSDLMRKVGASRESILKWTNERKLSAGVRPEFFRKMVEVLGVVAHEIEADDVGAMSQVDALVKSGAVTVQQLEEYVAKAIPESAPIPPRRGKKAPAGRPALKRPPEPRPDARGSTQGRAK